jgi:hypothetical protein
MLLVAIPHSIIRKIPSGQVMKVKLEIDKDPPVDFETEAKYLFQPIPFFVNTFTLPNLFAGKMHAILCRAWGNRVKGRDWYDLVWFVGRGIALNLKHLAHRMRQTGQLLPNETLTDELLKQKIYTRIATVDFEIASKEVANFIKDQSSLELWSADFFKVIGEKIKTIN